MVQKHDILVTCAVILSEYSFPWLVVGRAAADVG